MKPRKFIPLSPGSVLQTTMANKMAVSQASEGLYEHNVLPGAFLALESMGATKGPRLMGGGKLKLPVKTNVSLL